MTLIRLLVEPILVVSKHYELFVQLTKREVELRHKGSHLGLVWSVLQPLMLLGVYVFVFGFIFGGSFEDGESRIEFGLKIFIGIVCLHFVTEVLAGAPICVLSNPSYVKKVVFPVEMLPISSAASAMFHFVIGLGLVTIGIAISGNSPSTNLLVFPIILFPMILLVLGVSWILATLGIFFRDISQIVPFLSVVLLFSSAVFYSPSEIPEEAYRFLQFNPLMHFIDFTRKTLITSEPIEWGWVGYLYLVGFAFFQLGFRFFMKMKNAFADVI